MQKIINSIEELLTEIEALDFEDLNEEEKKWGCSELNRQYNSCIKIPFEKEQLLKNRCLGYREENYYLLRLALQFRDILRTLSYKRRAKIKDRHWGFIFPTRDKRLDL